MVALLKRDERIWTMKRFAKGKTRLLKVLVYKQPFADLVVNNIQTICLFKLNFCFIRLNCDRDICVTFIRATPDVGWAEKVWSKIGH